MSSAAGLEVRASSIYKKKEGTLSISKNQKSIIWTAIQPGDAAPGVIIDVVNITNLQQTPESAAKVMLKVFEKPANVPEAAQAITHLFNFNSPKNPREEANAIKEVLTNLIAVVKASDLSLPRANGVSTAAPTATVAVPTVSSDQWYEDAQLKNDIALQQSLMKKDSALQRTYMESRRTKPETITDSQFNAHFWSTRTSVLRAHAVEMNQRKGQVNILSVVKPKDDKMTITPEHLQLIFSQHPLMQRIYDENVPKLNEVQFWERFFLSRLYKKLKGEEITDFDSSDPTFDRYLDKTYEKRLDETQIPNFIDLEANEENQGGMKGGNRKDYTMRPDNVPIIRSINNVSERMMSNVAPSDIDPANPIGMDEETFNSLALRDLQATASEDRIELNIKPQGELFANDKSTASDEAKLYAKQVPSEVLLEMESDLVIDADAKGGLDLHSAIGVLDDSDSEDEDKVPHVGSKSSFIDAHKHLMEGIFARRKEIDGTNSKSALAGLSETIFQRLTLTHATTTEFLNHFWLIFLSGDAERAGDLAKMVESLDRAMERINAVAADAEKERQELISRHRQHIKDVYNRTQKKIQWSSSSVGGGEKVAKEMMEPIIKTLGKALADYRKAFVTESAEAA